MGRTKKNYHENHERPRFGKIQMEEIDAFIRQLEKQKGEPCNVQPALSASLCNSMFSLIFGYHLTPDHPKMTIIRNLLTSFPKVFRQTGLHCLIPTIIGFFKKWESILVQT
ncbi:hypothetical protein CEXT_112291 [Caerostris extrusa]|uniref:Uncharacterized protein n=1 Tax=Caerostris extrusa TaxID=172846 RepID=A0AAV4NFC7_CAEEX|nr:hypothetical protein CEXT_112291 [Caerostris extrusa]